MTFPEEFNPNEMYPVFIILSNKRKSFIEQGIKFFTRGEYSHVAICIDRTFKEIYQIVYNEYKKGLSIGPYNQSLYMREDNNCSIYVGWVSKSSYELMKSKLDYYASQEANIRYSMLSAVFAYFNKVYTNKDVNIDLFCSEFVALILNMDKQRTNKNSHIVLPEDFKKEGRFQLIYKGPTKNMNPKKINEAAEIAKKVVIARGSYDSYIMEEKSMFSDGYNDFTDFVEESLIEFNEYGEIAEEGTSMDALKTLFTSDCKTADNLVKDGVKDMKAKQYEDAKSKFSQAQSIYKKLAKEVSEMEESYFDSIVGNFVFAAILGIPLILSYNQFSMTQTNQELDKKIMKNKSFKESFKAQLKKSWSKTIAIGAFDMSSGRCAHLIRECNKRAKNKK